MWSIGRSRKTRGRGRGLKANIGLGLAALALALPAAAQQIRPNVDILWPACTGGANSYNIVLGTCVASGTAANPAGADQQVQYNMLGGFAGSPQYKFNYTTNNLTVQSVNQQANLASQTGSGSSAQFTSWINACNAGSVNCFLWVDPTAASGAPGAPLGTQETVIDARGTNSQDQFGAYSNNGNNDNSLAFYKVETRNDAAVAPANVYSSGFSFGYASIAGAVDNYVGTASAWSSGTTYYFGQIVTYSGTTYTALLTGSNHTPSSSPTYWLAGGNTKSTRNALYARCLFTSPAQNWCTRSDLVSYSPNEGVGFGTIVTASASPNTGGSEAPEGLRVQMQQVVGSPSPNRAQWYGTASSVSGSSPTFTVAYTAGAPCTSGTQNGCTLGAGRPIRDLSRSVSGTGLTYNGAGSITLTGGGLSALPNYSTSAGFIRWNTGGISSNSFLAVDALLCTSGTAGTGEFGSGYDSCWMVDSMQSDSQLTVAACYNVLACIHTFDSVLAAAGASLHWAVYTAVLPTAINVAGSTFTAQGAATDTAIPIGGGDSLDQPISSQGNLWGALIVVNTQVGTGQYPAMGIWANNTGLVGSTDETSAKLGGPGFLAEGPFTWGWLCYMSHPTTSLQAQYCGGVYGNSWPNTGFLSLPSTPPTTQSGYPLVGPYVEFSNYGADLSIGQNYPIQLQLSTGNVTFAGSISSPLLSAGGYSNQALYSEFPGAACPGTVTGWTAAEAPTLCSNTTDLLSPLGDSTALKMTVTTLSASTTGLSQSGVAVVNGQTYQMSVWMATNASNSGNVTGAFGWTGCPFQGEVLAPGAAWQQYTLTCTWTGSTGTTTISVGLESSPPVGSIVYLAQMCVQNITTGSGLACPTTTSVVVGPGVGIIADNKVLPTTFTAATPLVATQTGNVLNFTCPTCTQQHFESWTTQPALFATSTMLGGVYYEANGGTLLAVTARLEGTISCTTAPTVNILDLGTSATTAYGSATSLKTLATGTSDGAFSSTGLSIAITAGHYVGLGFSAGTCVTAPTIDVTTTVQ
jgi:hypothetical protein